MINKTRQSPKEQGQVAGDMENMLINKFISEGLDYWDVTGDPEPQYTILNEDQKASHDITTFKFFNQAYKDKQVENPKYESISFDNFLKLYRPEGDWNTNLKDFDKVDESIDAKLWRDIYGRDTGLMKRSALEGLKRVVAAQAD